MVIREVVLAWRLAHPCVDCGERDPLVLQADHRDRSTKKADISEMGNWPVAIVLAELEKCDSRCANCHQRKTFLERDYLPPNADPAERDPAVTQLALIL